MANAIDFTTKNDNRKTFHKGTPAHRDARAQRRVVSGAFGNLSKKEQEVLARGTSKEGKI